MRPVLVFRVTSKRLHMLCRSARSDSFTAPTLGPRAWHDAQVTTLARMIGQGRSWWYTTAFWLVFVVCLYLALLMADWWWLILVALIGVTINYCWWSVERVQHKFRVVFSAVLGGFTLLILAVAGWLVLHTISVPPRQRRRETSSLRLDAEPFACGPAARDGVSIRRAHSRSRSGVHHQVAADLRS